MPKFNFKSRTVIVSLLTVVLLGFGVKYPEQIGQFGGGIYCSVVKCDA